MQHTFFLLRIKLQRVWLKYLLSAMLPSTKAVCIGKHNFNILCLHPASSPVTQCQIVTSFESCSFGDLVMQLKTEAQSKTEAQESCKDHWTATLKVQTSLKYHQLKISQYPLSMELEKIISLKAQESKLSCTILL